MERQKREIIWIICIFALLIVGIGIIVELDLWIPVQNVLKLEAVWMLSGLFIISFIIGAAVLHHKKVAKGKSAVDEFRMLPHSQKASLVVFLFSLSLMIIALVLTKVKGIHLTGFEREEEWFIIIVALLTYFYMVIKMSTKDD